MASNSSIPNTYIVSRLNAFTIIELLIVIVIISILTTITVLAYSGFSSKATVSSIQADLTNAKKQLLSFQTTSPTNSFPTALNCTNPTSTEICIRPTGSNTFNYTPYNNTTPASFYLTSTNNNTTYTITESTNPLTQSSIITNGLVLNLDAGDTASYPGTGTTWYDLSGKGNNGTLLNGVGYDSANGGSLTFDGVDDYVTSSSPINNSLNGFTAEVILQANDAGNSGNAYLIFDHGAGGYSLWLGKSQTNEWYYFWNFGSSKGRSARLSSVSYTANSYINISVRASLNSTPISTGNYSELIVNGTNYSNVHRNDVATAYGFPTQSLRVAKRESSFNNGELGATVAPYSNIRLSDLRIYNRVLTRSEIQQNFNALRGRYGI